MPSTLALVPILTALVAKLKADAILTVQLASGAASVYNTAPAGAAFPNLTVGQGTEIALHTMGPDGGAKWGANCTVQITMRAKDETSIGGSDLPLLTAISRVKALCDCQPLTVAGFGSAVMELDSVPAIFSELVDGRQARTQALILRVRVHEGAR